MASMKAAFDSETAKPVRNESKPGELWALNGLTGEIRGGNQELVRELSESATDENGSRQRADRMKLQQTDFFHHLQREAPIRRSKQPGLRMDKFKVFSIHLTILSIVYGMTTGFSIAQNWFPTSAPQQSWTALAMSSDGNKVLAVSSQGPIFTSSNGGACWTQTSAPSDYWTCAASSSDGVNLVAATGYLNGQIYRSTDSGATWAPTGVPGNAWTCIASSADGSTLVAGAFGYRLYVSTNSGIDWTGCILGQYWGPVYCSADGRIMAAAGGGGQSVFISTSSGASWSMATNLPALTWSSLVGSTNGNDLILVSDRGQLFTSTNTGASWVSNSLPNGISGSIAVSEDARTWVMGITGAICTSTNFGLTWTTNSAPNNVGFGPVACSADGGKMAAVGNGQIYVSPPVPQPKGKVVAWGGNFYGQATVPDNLGSATAIAGSEYDSLAVKSDGTVMAWGHNDSGETNAPPDLTDVVAVAGSQELSLALKHDGMVAWWGLAWWGWPSNTNIILSLSNIVAIAASPVNFYLALHSNGIVTAWGANNQYGQTNVPVGLSNVVAIAAGNSHCVALINDGTVAAWGGNVAVPTNLNQANIPAGISNVVAIAAGDTSSLALRIDGSVIGWPTNDDQVVLIPAGMSNVVAIAAEYTHAMALTRDGSVWEWGNVGTGSLNYQIGLPNLVAIACGSYHSLAIVGDGSPVVVRQPWNHTVYAGHSAILSAGVVGAPPLSYQWQLNSTNVLGATNYFLTITNLQQSDGGRYCLAASNELGITISSNATLMVLTNPPILTWQPTNQIVFIGSNVTFVAAAAAGPAPITYQWQFNKTNIDWATNLSLTLTNVQPVNQGIYNIIAANNFGAITSSDATLTVTGFPPTAVTIQPSYQLFVAGSNVSFTATANGSAPLNYQWRLNGTSLSWATGSVLTLTSAQPTNEGNYDVVVSNYFGSITSSYALLSDLATAVNSPGLTWTSSGDATWFPETTVTHDGVEAAQSRPVGYRGQSLLQTTVTGPGTLTFWWMFSPLTGPLPNTLSFSSSQVDASASVNSTSGWQQETIYLGTGQQTLRWIYSRFSSAQSTGWVDQVSFTPGSTTPTITSMSPNIYVRANSDVALSVNAYGTPHVAYQWQLNGTNLFNQTNTFLSLSGAQPENSGVYSVSITNDYGSVVTNATLWVAQLGLTTSRTNLFLSTNGFQLEVDGILTSNSVIILGSTDLVNWLALFTNSPATGSIHFLDVYATNAPARFYRAQE
jgi:hypothetical protein